MLVVTTGNYIILKLRSKVVPVVHSSIPIHRLQTAFAYVILYLLSFSASNNLTVTVWRNRRIVYVLSTLSQLTDNVQVTRITSNKDGRE